MVSKMDMNSGVHTLHLCCFLAHHKALPFTATFAHEFTRGVGDTFS